MKQAHQATVLGSLFQLLTLMPWEKAMPGRSDHTGIPRSHFSLAHTKFLSKCFSMAGAHHVGSRSVLPGRNEAF